MPRPPARNLLDDAPVTNTRGRRQVAEEDLAQLRRLIRAHARLDLSPAQVRSLLAQDAALNSAVLGSGTDSEQTAGLALDALAQTLLRQRWPTGTDETTRARFTEALYRRAAEAGYHLAE